MLSIEGLGQEVVAAGHLSGSICLDNMACLEDEQMKGQRQSKEQCNSSFRLSGAQHTIELMQNWASQFQDTTEQFSLNYLSNRRHFCLI